MQNDFLQMLQVAAELLSAIAASITVFLALIELTSRSRAKKADIAMGIYAEFLSTVQNLRYMAAASDGLARNCQWMSPAEIRAYSTAHMVDPSVNEGLDRIKNQFVSSTNFSRKEGQINSKIVLDLVGQAKDLVLTVNTHYTLLATMETPDPKEIRKHCQRISDTYEKLSEGIEKAEAMLHGNLLTLRGHSTLYLCILLILAAFFILLNYFL